MLASPIELGQVTIHRVVEQQMPFLEAVKFFPTLTQEMLEENRSWLQPTFLEPGTDKVIFCFQSYVVRTPHHNIIVDTCVGNDKPRPTRGEWHLMKSDVSEKGLAVWGPFRFSVDPKLPVKQRIRIYFRPNDVYVTAEFETLQVKAKIAKTRFKGTVIEFKLD